jgi:protein SDA1
LAYFKVKFDLFLKSPNKRIKGMKEMFMFFAQVGHIYPSEMAFIPMALINLIENNYTVINPEIRMAIVESLSLLRKKDLLDTLE